MAQLRWTALCALVLFLVHVRCDRVLLESQGTQNGAWILQSEKPIDPLTPVTLTIALKQQNRQQLEEIFWDVSDPTSRNYGQYLNHEQVGSLIAPTSDSVNAVTDWLSANNVEDLTWTAHKEFVRARMPVSTAETLLATPFVQYISQHGGHSALRAAEDYSIPAHLQEHIHLVGNVARLPQIKPQFVHNVEVNPSSNAPIIISNHQGAGQLQFFWAVVCFDGTFATDQDSPCVNQGGQVNSFRLVTYPVDVNYATAQVTAEPSYADSDCKIGANWPEPFYDTAMGTYGNETVYCLATFSGFSDYVPYIVQLMTNYDGQTVPSNAYTFPYPLVTLPWTTVALLREQYTIPSGSVNTNQSNSQSVIEFLEQYYSPKDLTLFLEANGIGDQEVEVRGFNNASLPGGEASLDIQYMLGLSPSVRTVFWSDQRLHDNQEPFYEWLVDLANTTNPPLVISLSYDDQESDLSLEYMDLVNGEFIKAGVRGLSLLFAAGDDGVGGYYARGNSSYCEKAQPTFPGSSPYITSVGGTQLSRAATGICAQSQGFPAASMTFACSAAEGLQESVCSTATGARITTGGGFSERFAAPAYQTAVVHSYLASGAVPESSYFNASGRAYPDIAANAHNYVVWINGIPMSVDGTSASTPVVAAMITLINDARLNLGKPPMGFLNPWLYKTAAAHPQAFNDIVRGDNNCTANMAVCCPQGFGAARGWDAVTGLGTPNFLTLRNAALNPAQPYPDAQFIGSIQPPPADVKGQWRWRIGLLAALAALGLVDVVLIVAIIVLSRRSAPGYEPLNN